jgi:hypothetical protein
MDKTLLYFQEFLKLQNYSKLKKFKAVEFPRELSYESAEYVWNAMRKYSHTIFISNIEGVNLTDLRLMLITNYLDSGIFLDITKEKITDAHWKTLSAFKAFAQNIKYNFEKWYSDLFFNIDQKEIETQINDPELYRINKIPGLFIYNLYPDLLYNIISIGLNERFHKTLSMLHIKLRNEQLKGYINPIIGGFFNNEKTIYV